MTRRKIWKNHDVKPKYFRASLNEGGVTACRDGRSSAVTIGGEKMLCCRETMAEEINIAIALKIFEDCFAKSPAHNTPITFAIRRMYPANSFHRWRGPPPPMVEAEE